MPYTSAYWRKRCFKVAVYKCLKTVVNCIDRYNMARLCVLSHAGSFIGHDPEEAPGKIMGEAICALIEITYRCQAVILNEIKYKAISVACDLRDIDNSHCVV